MENKKVLVLLSSYNGEKYISQQLESILNQESELLINVLIRDDGSTDSTLSIIEEYKNRYPKRVEVIRGNNIGYIKSFFELIKIADDYDYYALSDQDDVWLPNKIQLAVNYLEKENNNIPLLYACPSYLVHDDLFPYGTTQLKKRDISFFNTIIQNFFPGHNQVFNQKLLNELKKPIDYSKIYCHDAWITNVAIIKGTIIFNNAPCTYYRQHGKNEIGFGEGKIGWINERLKRIKKGDSKKYAVQIKSFFEIYHDDMSENQKKELNSFFDSQRFAFSRLRYCCSCKMYRQTFFQTLLFKLLFVFNGYNISH